MISDEVTVSGSLPRLFSMSYIKKDKHKVQPAIPVMSRIAVNGTITQFSVPPHLWKAKGDRAKGKSLEADRINRHPDNIRIRIGKHCRFICDPDFTSEADSFY